MGSVLCMRSREFQKYYIVWRMKHLHKKVRREYRDVQSVRTDCKGASEVVCVQLLSSDDFYLGG